MKKAKRIADVLIRERIAACVSIYGLIKSIYWWRGNVEKSEEYLLLIKNNTG